MNRCTIERRSSRFRAIRSIECANTVSPSRANPTRYPNCGRSVIASGDDARGRFHKSTITGSMSCNPSVERHFRDQRGKTGRLCPRLDQAQDRDRQAGAGSAAPRSTWSSCPSGCDEGINLRVLNLGRVAAAVHTLIERSAGRAAYPQRRGSMTPTGLPHRWVRNGGTLERCAASSVGHCPIVPMDHCCTGMGGTSGCASWRVAPLPTPPPRCTIGRPCDVAM